MPVSILRYAALSFLSASLPALQCSFANAQEPQVFHNPTLRGMRLDRCLTWATNCGDPAASLFCRYRGYSRAVDWKSEYISPTLVPGDGQICNGDGCSSFTEISCQ